MRNGFYRVGVLYRRVLTQSQTGAFQCAVCSFYDLILENAVCDLLAHFIGLQVSFNPQLGAYPTGGDL